MFCEMKESDKPVVCTICKNSKSKKICPFSGQSKYNKCMRLEFISRSDVKKNYIGVDVSNLNYTTEYISTYGVQAIYFYKPELEEALNQFNE